ncbi:PREDICTED: C-type lectin domain family 2 member D2-like [Gekko japonicus]|uniref:C-type lectin domain family 2 member D2-like n=1 Tax=Gekko japonicus TaxID=146911 RepID=A0ABM1KUD5_GEKJA|nr:PREDICTED: C-type lectin domain family 2 member D2-like [Gekko japonicus]
MLVFHSSAKLHQMPAAPSPPDTTSPTLDASLCPQRWVRNEGRCYFFSDTEQTWNASRINCSSQGGSLVAMDTPQEKEFVLGSQHLIYFWLDFWRDGVGKPWKRADGSLFNNT